ncbi:MAG: response regulator transcription factor [Chloroflexi bacterium]|nr:response regulator transcription factor [Chloroflexota bacterium]
MLRVVIVDDHPIVRAGIRAVLDAADGITVVAEGARGAEARDLVAAHRPDVLVLDVNLPDINGIEITRQLRARDTSPAILILTVHNDAPTIFGLLESGSAGYVLKDDALETIVNAVRAVARGETWLSPAIARQVVARATHQQNPKGLEDPSGLSSLTPREIEVLTLLAQGLDNAAIAERLVVTTRTIQNHVSAIYDKLGVASRTQAALIAIQRGLVQISPLGKTGDANES